MAACTEGGGAAEEETEGAGGHGGAHPEAEDRVMQRYTQDRAEARLDPWDPAQSKQRCQNWLSVCSLGLVFSA